VSPITAPGNSGDVLDFQSTQRLSTQATLAINEAFANGWLEPQKIHHGSAHLRNLLNEARESIAANLGVPKESLEFVGELGFGYWSALAGSVKNFSGTFVHGVTDRQVVHGFARELSYAGLDVRTVPTDKSGQLAYQSEMADIQSESDQFALFWQHTNRETGIQQRDLDWPIPSNSLLIADMTAAFRVADKPRDWGVALWDSRSFGGPEGLAILAIRPDSIWQSPIPPIDQRRLFGSYSKPLLLLTAIALDERVKTAEQEFQYLQELRRKLKEMISHRITGVKIVGDSENQNSGQQDPRQLALVADGVAAEEILRQLEVNGALIDAGSACGAGALSPSHVLEAMGFGETGHLRVTLRATHTVRDLERLVELLAREIELFRSNT
jgi:cysteine desulfurase